MSKQPFSERLTEAIKNHPTPSNCTFPMIHTEIKEINDGGEWTTRITLNTYLRVYHEGDYYFWLHKISNHFGNDADFQEEIRVVMYSLMKMVYNTMLFGIVQPEAEDVFGNKVFVKDTSVESEMGRMTRMYRGTPLELTDDKLLSCIHEKMIQWQELYRTVKERIDA